MVNYWGFFYILYDTLTRLVIFVIIIRRFLLSLQRELKVGGLWCFINYPFSIQCNKNVDIKFSAHNAFLEQPSSGTFNDKRLESQIIWSFGSNKTKGHQQNSYGYTCMQNVTLNFVHYLRTVHFSDKYTFLSNNPCQCRSTDYWADDTLGD